MANRHYLSAQEAAQELNVSLATLYAYVSRGLIRSEEAGGGRRSHRYLAEDVRRLKDRKEHRRHPEKAAEGALHFGVPVLESAITLIDNGRLYYRGVDAAQLARENTFEQVAALIWTGELNQDVFGDYELSARVLTVRARLADLPLFKLFQILLPLAEEDDPTPYYDAATAVQTGARIVQLMAAITAGVERYAGRTAEFLRQSWLPDQPQATRLIDTALILCADHELNVSAFTARCAASSEATLYDVVCAGLAALHGAKHGGHTKRVEALFREIGEVRNVRSTLRERRSRAEIIPGFGHPLYPNGDPRGRLLLDLTEQIYGDAPAVRLARAVEAEMFEMFQHRPTIDFALVTLANALRLPPGSALALFALGRAAGWIGHAVEQYALDTMIRPRARYTGMQPG